MRKTADINDNRKAFHCPEWIRKSVFYQIYPQSFCDSNADGIGDLRGIISKLTYIKSLGVDAIWLNPCFESTFKDAGYDITNFYRIAARYGTNEEMVELIEKAHRLDIRVILDLVAGHTSSKHPWFTASAASNNGKYADRYIWTSSKKITPDGFVSGDYKRDGSFEKNFFPTQPALNYGYADPDPEKPWQQLPGAPGPTAMREELKAIMKFWMDKGADGFRVDMAASLVKNDPEYRETFRLWGNIRSWFSDSFPEGVLVAEWGEPAIAVRAGFMIDFMMHYGVKGYNSLFFERENVAIPYENDPYFSRNGNGSATEFVTNFTYHSGEIEGKGFIALPTSNHDFQRLRNGKRQTEEELRLSLLFFFTWKSIPFLYYGDEIGMKYIEKDLPDKEGSVIPSDMLVEGIYENRAGSRTPMQWDNENNAGFSDGDSKSLYLPIDPDPERPNVADQESKPDSLLNFTRNLIQYRKNHPALWADAALEVVHAEDGKYPLVYKRMTGKEEFLICINPKDEPVSTKLSVSWGSGYREVFNQGSTISDSGNDQIELNMQAVSFGLFRNI